MSSQPYYCSGYMQDNQFHPLLPNTYLGYMYQNQFIRADEWDPPQALNMCLWNAVDGYRLLAPGTYPVFYFNQQYYYSLTAVQNACFVPLPPTSPSLPSTSQFPPSQPIDPPPAFVATSRSIPSLRSSAMCRTCTLCKYQKSSVTTLAGKIYCADCVLDRYVNDRLWFEEGIVRKEWTPEMIFEVHEYLSSVVSEENRWKMPAAVKYPCETVVCIGERKEVKSNYPPFGHFIGLNSLCKEGGCPDSTHILCRKCAAGLTVCPLCNSFIEYEELPAGCPEDCQQHCHSFTKPCLKCGKVTPRTKQRPGN